MTRRLLWAALYAWAALIGLCTWLVLVFLTPLLGQWPRSPRLAFQVARRHADEAYPPGGTLHP